jgi:hypothetical protein
MFFSGEVEMNLSELKEKIRAVKFHPIPVEDDMNEVRGLKFIGSLEEYFEAINALGKNTIFVTIQEVDEDDFQYDLKERSYDEEDGEFQHEVEEINLCLINPAFEKFKEKIGQICIFKLFSSMSEDSLTFYIETDWWAEYLSLYAAAIETIINDKGAAQEKIKAAQKEKNKELVKALRELRHDKDFSNLKTQRAMSAYAKEKIPELENLEPSLLRQEIQALYDKLRQ